MTILFGHPGGNPNSHHAALAHFEAGWLEAFCVPWMPAEPELALLRAVPGLRIPAARLARRHFAPLSDAPLVQGRFGEWRRMFKRLFGGAWADERLSYEANDWLMSVMALECRRPSVTAVHAYEDCALLQFQVAAKLGKSRIYDLPIGYYPAWEATFSKLAEKYPDWSLGDASGNRDYVRPAQKRQEMALADIVLVPSTFVKRTVQQFADREVAVAPYGVDTEFWSPAPGRRKSSEPIRFLYAGQCSLRKGIPLLLEAWKAASPREAVLDLVGTWRLAEARRELLPLGVRHFGPVSREGLRNRFREADVLILPSYFEGLALVILEALACGLPVIATDATGGADVLDDNTGMIVPAGDLDSLVASIRWAAGARGRLEAMRSAARQKAEAMTWERYRACVTQATAPFAGGGPT